MQITTLILAPTFFTAGIYIILGRLITVFGPSTSPISSNMYLWIFCTCDIVSLVVQAIGGAMAAEAVASDPPRSSSTGTNIMVAGIVFQMFSVTIFAILFVIFLKRVLRNKRLGVGKHIGKKTAWLIYASTFCTVMIYVRSIYRTIELAQGWTGYLITHEGYFLGLDGALMFLAVAVFNVVHPGWCIPTTKKMSREETPCGTEDEEVKTDA